MKLRSNVPMIIAKFGYIIMSVIFCTVGVLFIAFSGFSTLIIEKALGIALITFGCIKLVGYFSKDLFRLAFQYDLGFGILLIVLGLIVLIRPESIMNFIFIALGISILADAMFKVQIAIDSKKFGISTWWLILSVSLLTGLIGILLVFRPTESAEALTVILGVSLLAEGILNLCVAVTTVKIVKHQKPDSADNDYINK